MYEKIVIFNTLLYPLWCFYFSRQILRERLSPSKTYLCILFMHIILIIGSYELMPDHEKQKKFETISNIYNDADTYSDTDVTMYLYYLL